MIQRLSRLLLLSTLSLPLNACPGTGTPGSLPPSPAASPQETQAYTLPLQLNNGQALSLEMQVQGTTLTGELVVADPSLRAQQISRSFAFGRYGFTGSLSLPRGFSLSGSFPEPVGRFDISGILPTLTEPGSFTFRNGDENVSDILPALNTLPSPTPFSSPTPLSSPTPVNSPSSPTPSVSPSAQARTWSEPELRQIIVCFGEQASLQLTGSYGAYANGLSRLNAYVATQESLSAEAHQARLDDLGTDLVSANGKMGFDCLP
ncbi:MAG: hypothetical protein ACO1RX_22160 [Candidatus Sericytochromatia bacterium]